MRDETHRSKPQSSRAQTVSGRGRPRCSLVKWGPLAGVVGFLAFVVFTSGILQGYYTPMLTDIARHLGINDADVNWLEGTQLMLAALVVPAFAKLGAACLVGIGYLLFLPFHDTYGQLVTNRVIAGIGSGALVAALPAAAVGGIAGSLSGYFTVWTICGATALVATVLLFFVPKRAFQDRP